MFYFQDGHIGGWEDWLKGDDIKKVCSAVSSWANVFDIDLGPVFV